ncbi:MAG: neutral/alkaline non-lysosomal ceramidase N-terminal domain-containing protein [Verrucomicrobia bacterium]|nr:neutral/alkaline non-lysosomal ceramidase N-terminal domain-containing protein [Verrucomicrobiota bacterium]
MITPPSRPAGLQAGAATVDITPRASVFLYGYPHVPRHSAGVHDPLECAALYLRSGADAALFLANDLIFLTKELVAEARRRIAAATGLAEGAIMLTCTHTHSGPVMSKHLSNASDPVVPPVDPAYLGWLVERLTEAAVAAVKAAVPAEIGLTTVRAEGVGSNRHDPAGPTDAQVPVLVARARADRAPVGCMIVYGMHPTVLHEDSKLISADFPFFTRQFLRAHGLPAKCPVLFHQGASGNQSPRHMTRANTFAEARRLGELLGQTIAAAMPAMAFRESVEVRCRQCHLDPEPRVFPAVAAADEAVEKVRARFERLKREGAPRTEVRTAECDVFGAEETAELARAAVDGRLAEAVAGCVPAEIQLIAVGPWKFVGWPGEFFVEYALELKRRSPDTFLITLANGELQGYVVTAEAAARGVYESTNALFAPANGGRFIEATLALLAGKR